MLKAVDVTFDRTLFVRQRLPLFSRLSLFVLFAELPFFRNNDEWNEFFEGGTSICQRFIPRRPVAFFEKVIPFSNN